MTVIARKKNNKWLLIATLVVIIALMVIAYIQLNKKQYNDELEAWLKDNQITYKALSVSNKGHFQITEAKVSFGSDLALTSALVEGDMSKNSGVDAAHLEDVSFSLAGVDFDIPNASFINATSSASADDAPWMQNMHPFVKSLLNATISEVNVPTIEIRYDASQLLTDDVGGAEFGMTYNDVAFKDIKAGFVKFWRFKSSSMNMIVRGTSSLNAFDGLMKTGEGTVKDVNIKAIMTFIFEPAGDKKEVLKLYGEQTISDLNYLLNAKPTSANNLSQKIVMSVDKITTSPVSVMQQNIPPAQWGIFSKDGIEQILKNDDKMAELGLRYLELIESVEPLSSSIQNQKTVSRASAKGDEEIVITQKYDEVGFSYTGIGVNYEARNLTYSLQSEDKLLMRYSLDNLSLRNLRIPEVITNGKQLIKEYLANKKQFLAKINDKEFEQTLMTMFMPRIDEFYLSGLKVDSSVLATQKELKNNTILSLGSVRLKADYAISYIPTAFVFDVKDVTVPITLLKDKEYYYSDNPREYALNNLGYDTLTFSSKIDLSWDKVNNVLSLNTYSFDIKDMMTYKMSAQLANVNEWLFSGDPVMMAAAATNFTFKSFDMATNIDPLRARFDKFNQSIGKKSEETYAYVANEYRTMLEKNFSKLAMKQPEMTVFLSNVNEKLINAVNDFVTKGGTLEIIFNTKSANGLSLADFIGQKDLSASLLEKINFTAQTKH